MWFKGWTKEKAEKSPYRKDRRAGELYYKSEGNGFIPFADIPLVFDELFYSAVNEYLAWKRFGLPHGAGWMNERALWVRAVTIVDEEHGVYESRKIEESRNGSRGTKGSRSH